MKPPLLRRLAAAVPDAARQYIWHFMFAAFILLSLANIFQKLKWSSATDHIAWEPGPQGLVCRSAPAGGQVRPGDILLAVNKYQVGGRIDLLRAIAGRNYCRYEIERDGILKNVGVDIDPVFTPFSYYILVFVGILSVLLTLGILNVYVRQATLFPPPQVFFVLSLTLSGFLIFSPTGDFGASDYLFTVLDAACFALFPAVLLHYALQYPLRARGLKRLNSRLRDLLIYLTPLALLAFNGYFVLHNLLAPDAEVLTTTINHFRSLGQKYFAVYVLLAWARIGHSSLSLVLKKRQKRYLVPLAGISLSFVSLLLLNFTRQAPEAAPGPLVYLSMIFLPFLPLSLVYFLSPRRVTDIENIIKKTLSISSLFLFIFGTYLFLGLNIGQNKLLGIFWSLAAILMAGLLFKPLEGTLQRVFERLFYRETFNFKRKLKELEGSISAQRDLSSLSQNFLEIIGRGFQLQAASLLVPYRNNLFYSLPGRRRFFLTRSFLDALQSRDHLVFLSEQEFATKFPGDQAAMPAEKLFQFQPLRIGERLVGVVAMGRKTDHSYLTVEDWDLMASIASPLALSVENAFLYSRLEGQLAELNQLKEFNENIIENINLGILVVSRLNLVQTWNTFMEERWGIPRAKALRKRAPQLLGRELWERLQPGQPGTHTLRNVKVPIGEAETFFDLYVSPLKDESGSISGRIFVFEDVTEKNRIQNQLVTSEKMASLGLLSAGIAHEINTPLTGISSYCQFLLDNPGGRDNPELIAKMQDQVLRANKIVRTLLDFSRQKGQQPGPVDLNRVLDESLALVEHKLKKKNIRVRREAEFRGRFAGFPTRLQQLFINLFINAIDAIDGEGWISVGGEESAEQVTVRFKDSGRGIAPRDLERIFDPFFTTKDVGQGTGLGLAIVYNIVKEHYGEIEAHSRVGRGTTFIITFPLQSPLRSMNL
ncbi:MAG TPA: ATP-binding protein [Candidatus Aminicenantes bacterium]|nr:ATP-binding protein [Candidatus Aminicenantes bacterium]